MKTRIAVGIVALSAMLSPASAGGAAPMPSWNGFSLSAGGGYGMWGADMYQVGLAPPFEHVSGAGWFGTVGIGFDREFSSSWVAGVQADAQFGDINGTIGESFAQFYGNTSNRLTLAAGVRLGYLATRVTLLYVNGGYSHAEFTKSTQLSDTNIVPLFVDLQHRDGWFVGGGVETSLEAMGVAAPGWSAKFEYRFADYGSQNVDVLLSSGIADGNKVSFSPDVQTFSLSLVHRFGGK
jgi:outer membrane immunogenic protein